MSFENLPSEIHYFLFQILPASSAINLLQTSNKIRNSYSREFWSCCNLISEIDDESEESFQENIDFRPITWKVFINPHKYSWYQNTMIKKFIIIEDFSRSEIIDSNLYSSISHFKDSQYPSLKYIDNSMGAKLPLLSAMQSTLSEFSLAIHSCKSLGPLQQSQSLRELTINESNDIIENKLIWLRLLPTLSNLQALHIEFRINTESFEFQSFMESIKVLPRLETVSSFHDNNPMLPFHLFNIPVRIKNYELSILFSILPYSEEFRQFISSYRNTFSSIMTKLIIPQISTFINRGGPGDIVQFFRYVHFPNLRELEFAGYLPPISSLYLGSYLQFFMLSTITTLKLNYHINWTIRYHPWFLCNEPWILNLLIHFPQVIRHCQSLKNFYSDITFKLPGEMPPPAPQATNSTKDLEDNYHYTNNGLNLVRLFCRNLRNKFETYHQTIGPKNKDYTNEYFNKISQFGSNNGNNHFDSKNAVFDSSIQYSSQNGLLDTGFDTGDIFEAQMYHRYSSIIEKLLFRPDLLTADINRLLNSPGDVHGVSRGNHFVLQNILIVLLFQMLGSSLVQLKKLEFVEINLLVIFHSYFTRNLDSSTTNPTSSTPSTPSIPSTPTTETIEIPVTTPAVIARLVDGIIQGIHSGPKKAEFDFSPLVNEYFISPMSCPHFNSLIYLHEMPLLEIILNTTYMRETTTLTIIPQS